MALVVETWGAIKELPDYEEVAGVLLFRKIFEVEPAAQKIFDFGRNHPIGAEALFQDPIFLKHARTVIRMVTTAVSLLESGDMVTLVAALQDLGARHVTYGVTQDHYPIVGTALILTLDAALGEAFTPDVEREWTDVANVIFTTMLTTW